MEKTEAYAEIHVFQLHQLNIYIKLCKSTKISNMIFTSYNIHIESRHNIWLCIQHIVVHIKLKSHIQRTKTGSNK